MKSLCVYCGSSDKVGGHYLEAARQMGAAVAQRGIELVYGAGSTGLMGALADGVLEAGGEVVGVITEQFNTPELAHYGLTRLEVVADMHTRKARMFELADGFAALPGGYGTLEEFFEVLTWAQIGLHSKPVGLLNVQGYYDPLLGLVEHISEEGFIYSEHRRLFVSEADPQVLLDGLENYHPPEGLARWVDRGD